MTKPLILITNDDGIQADGIKHVWHALKDDCELAIVAPHAEKSGSGMGITWSKPLQIRPVPWDGDAKAWSINGTPADCVKMGISILLKRAPDLIVSGVNRGSNAGRTVFHSGTVGAVIEGALRKVPGIAFSFRDFEFPSLGCVKDPIASIVRHFLKHPFPHHTFLNVTFPSNCKEGIRGFRMARQGHGYWIENPEQRIHPEGIPYYWLGGRWAHHEEHPESDVSLLEEGFLTAVPIHVGELTDHQFLDRHRVSMEKLHLSSFNASDCAEARSSLPPGRS